MTNSMTKFILFMQKNKEGWYLCKIKPTEDAVEIRFIENDSDKNFKLTITEISDMSND